MQEKFARKQQLQSRLDGGVELDGSRRQLLETTPQELPGHHVLEHHRAHAEQRPLLSLCSHVSLQGSHKSLMPTYRLPQRTFNITSLDEVGMASEEQRAEAVEAPPRWCTGEEDDYVVGLARARSRNDGVEQHVTREDYVADANAFALSYCRDFRALHQLSHDHDCRSTCVKYVKKKAKAAAEEAVKRGMVVACRFFFYHILEFACSAVQPVLRLGQKAIKRIRRKGKKLVEAPYVACTNDRNEFGKIVVVQAT